MKTIFPKENKHKPKWYLIDAKNFKLGKLASKIVFLLKSKNNSYYNPSIDQGNFVIVINAEEIFYTKKKEENILYYRNSQRPGSLKIRTLKNLKLKNSSLILQKAIWGMLPKGILGRIMFKRLYIYPKKNIKINKSKINRLKFIESYNI